QGRAGVLPIDVSSNAQHSIKEHSEISYLLYQDLLDPNVDLSRELSRMVLPVNIYTECYWKIDLHNLFHFLSLRNDPHAQHEVKGYAEIIDALVAGWVPLAHHAFKTYRQDAISFSAVEQPLIRFMLINPLEHTPEFKPEFAEKLSQREWVALI